MRRIAFKTGFTRPAVSGRDRNSLFGPSEGGAHKVFHAFKLPQFRPLVQIVTGASLGNCDVTATLIAARVANLVANLVGQAGVLR